jgi:hypothetical protein
MAAAKYATVSSKIRLAVWARRAAGDKVHQLARLADVHPSIFSALVNDITPIKAGDPRVLRIAEVLGVPAGEAFTKQQGRG